MAVKSQTPTLKLGSRCDIVDYDFLNYLNVDFMLGGFL